MAVYKATLCYPFLNSIDIRTAQYKDYISQPVQLLTCQIDSSNTEITGYKIKILSSDNQQVFPVDAEGNPVDDEKISPISELQNSSLGYDEDKLNINSGLNGTTLRIPFFQNYNNKLTSSFNAVYYKPKFLVDHIIAPSDETGLPSTTNPMDDISNWTYNDGELVYNWPAGTPESTIRENDIKLDGETILIGEIVLVLGSTGNESISGLYEVTGQFDEEHVIMTTVLKKQDVVINNMGVTITKGKTLYNYTYTYNPDATPKYSKSSTGGEWVNKDGDVIFSLLDSNNSTYKWEITLYQGNYELNSDGSISYVDVDPEWLDITLASGKIMGSTPNRIQIASDDDDDSGSKTIYLPEGIDKAPIVLQGKYIELCNTAPVSIASGGVRTYVKTYDSVYGHIYPREDTLATTDIDSASYCQFFKYSSNPDEILDTDIVNFCFNTNVTLNGYKIISTDVSTEEQRLITKTWENWIINPGDEKTSITSRYISIDITNYTNLIKDGDLILLANQTSAEQNGVYQINKITANPAPGETDNGVKWCLKRVNGYNTWASYIGKIIYCQNGSDGMRSMNMQSLASAGGTLWDINSNSSGSSLLYFTQERPVLLFPQNVNGKFNLYDAVHASNDRAIVIGGYKYQFTTIDGATVSKGDKILFKDKKTGVVSKVDNTGFFLENDPVSVDDGLYYVLSGEQYKELVLNINGDTAIAPSWALHTAKILHNTPTKTFISPWKNLQKNMKLALLNNKSVKYYKNDTFTDPTRWITITGLNDTIYYITHDSLKPSDSDSLVPAPLISYEKDSLAIPWSYDIRSFFKASDENPFYSYQTPYITLLKNNESYSDLHILGGGAFFYIRPDNAEFQVFNKQDSGNSLLASAIYKAQVTVNGRSVKLQGVYNGLGQSAWESYQWILYDENGNIVQDTGKKYDKNMSVVFFGLSNDMDESVVYYALLLVENNFGDIISYEIELKIDRGLSSSFLKDGGEFTVQFDCSTHSNIVHYRESAALNPEEDNVYLYSIYRREYNILTNPKSKIYGYYNDGHFYKDELLQEEIIGNTRYIYIDFNTKHVYQYTPTTQLFTLTDGFKIYKGGWQPVLVSAKNQWFRDFNIANDRSYEYIIYPTTSIGLEYGLDSTEQTFANYSGLVWYTPENTSDDPLESHPITDTTYEGKLDFGRENTSIYSGEPTHTHWESWSITELIPEENDIDAPIIRKKYKVDNNNIWLFKYSLETGSQIQNISKEEFSTLGRFSKFGFGDKNYESGSVTALLGSELILSSKVQYTERLGKSRVMPLSSNERATMLEQWNKFCYSKNPKLLKDIKGRSWVVQLISNSNTPQNLIYHTPDSINFEWRQVDILDNVIIYGDYTTQDKNIKSNIGAPEWYSPYNKKGW